MEILPYVKQLTILRFTSFSLRPKSAKVLWASTMAAPAPMIAKQNNPNHLKRSRIEPPEGFGIEMP
jgi:hypothetical protein